MGTWSLLPTQVGACPRGGGRGGGRESGLLVWGWGLGSAGLLREVCGYSSPGVRRGGDSECGPSPLRPPLEQAVPETLLPPPPTVRHRKELRL